jgi:hypothetical protein
MPLFPCIVLEFNGSSCVDRNNSLKSHVVERSVVKKKTQSIYIVVCLDDALVVSYGLMKNDQAGASCIPKHVYANPCSPEICPVLR